VPLTIAHPAAVIPLQNKLKNYGILSALIIGSLMPDIAYFPHMPITRLQSHSFLGMFWFCLPMGLITYYLFHNFMKEPLISLLPEIVAKKLSETSTNKIKYSNAALFFSICVSLLIGTATHILWDSFTHEDGFIVMAFPIFQAHLFSVFTYDVIVYKVLQHISTLVGTLLLVYWIFQWFTKSKSQNTKSVSLPMQQRVLIIGAMVLIIIAASLMSGYAASIGQSGLLAIQLFYKNMIVTTFVTASVLFILYSLIYQVLLSLQTHKIK
jgi:hypothetical protein